MIVKREKPILIFLHHFQEHFRPFSFKKVADSKDFHSDTSYQDPQWNIWPKILITHSSMIIKHEIFLYILYHFHKNSIFTLFSDPLNNRIWSSKIFFTYIKRKYTLLCLRKWKKIQIDFLDSLAGFVALGHICITLESFLISRFSREQDLEQLRNHMQWIHKVKIHPKMIYNRPPLNCQKCQFRFFTDQGLERHLLGSHGLVTSSMQEAANKGKDSGRCPVCGRVYQWKLLNHVARDHQMALKPAHLSYKCTVCTATFGMYKQFESHVYSAHSVVAKRAMDTKKPPVIPPPSSNQVLWTHLAIFLKNLQLNLL